MNIGLWIIIILGGAVGILSTLYCVVSLIAVLIYKVYRKIVHKIPMYNQKNSQKKRQALMVGCLPFRCFGIMSEMQPSPNGLPQASSRKQRNEGNRDDTAYCQDNGRPGKMKGTSDILFDKQLQSDT